MKKSVSLSRICLVVCAIILLATAVVTSPLGSLLPIFGFVALLAIIPLIRGDRTQKIVASVILAIAVTLFIFAIEDFKSQRQRLERIRKAHVQQLKCHGAKFDNMLKILETACWEYTRG